MNSRGLEHDGGNDAYVVYALPSAVRPLAIGRRHAVDDGCAFTDVGCAFADVGCERSARLSSSSGVLRNCVHDGCMSAEDGGLGAADGCSLSADVSDAAAALCVEADARRGFVHHGPLFAIVDGELSANGRELDRDA